MKSYEIVRPLAPKLESVVVTLRDNEVQRYTKLLVLLASSIIPPFIDMII
jgi:hypothetical protein